MHDSILDLIQWYRDNVPFNTWLAVSELIPGKKYVCKANNFHIGTWNGECFEYNGRCKGECCKQYEYYYDPINIKGTVKPLKIIN